MAKVATKKKASNEETRRAFRRMLARAANHGRSLYRCSANHGAASLADALQAVIGRMPEHTFAELGRVAHGERKLRARLPRGWTVAAAEQRWKDFERVALSTLSPLLVRYVEREPLEALRLLSIHYPEQKASDMLKRLHVTLCGVKIGVTESCAAWNEMQKTTVAALRRNAAQVNYAPATWEELSAWLMREIADAFLGKWGDWSASSILLVAGGFSMRLRSLDADRAIPADADLTTKAALKKHRQNTTDAQLFELESLEAAAAAVYRAFGFTGTEASNHVRAARQNRERRADMRAS